jgi:hypothetical protein
MEIYPVFQLEEAAVQRWGSLEGLEEEKHKRVARKEKKALEKANDMGMLNFSPYHIRDTCIHPTSYIVYDL